LEGPFFPVSKGPLGFETWTDRIYAIMRDHLIIIV
jgi:hypothetical protein